jgi:hypothetical protein
MRSVLDGLSRLDVRDDPFPHVVVSPALDEDTYERLAATFPRPDLMTPLSVEGRFACRARDLLDATRFGPTWSEFAALHSSKAFYRQVVGLFGDRIRALHPDLEVELKKPLEDVQSHVRFVEGAGEIALECQCVSTEPTSEPLRIIGPHVDRPVALYAGLLYFRDDLDDSTGGDLVLYRFKSDRRGFVEGTRRVPEELVEAVRVVEYARNSLILFPHSPDAVHGVSTRSASRYPRRHVNLVGEFPEALYDLGGDPSLPAVDG